MCKLSTLLTAVSESPCVDAVSVLSDFSLRLNDWRHDTHRLSALIKSAHQVANELALALQHQPSQLCEGGCVNRDWLGAAVSIICTYDDTSTRLEKLNHVDRLFIYAGCRDGLFVDYLKEVATQLCQGCVKETPQGVSLDFEMATQWSRELKKGLEKALKTGACSSVLELNESSTMMDFIDCLKKHCPVVLRNHYKSPNKEIFDCVLSVNRERLVPVETGRYYTRADWSIDIMSLGTFIASIDRDDVYLAQYPTLYHLPELEELLYTPPLLQVIEDYTTQGTIDTGHTLYHTPPSPHRALESGKIPIRNCWLGPAGKITPHHQDDYENLYTQVYGHKYFQLIPESHTADMKPYKKLMTNTSQHPPLSFLAPFVTADQKTTHTSHTLPTQLGQSAQHVILNPGDCLYVPKHFWHLVVGLTVNFGVSNWIN
eukprot:Blabericola_migrator_1__3950@NODE_219_length_11213_cov_124_951821_g186_i0_p4_GENE_NODE_219_length_11213_cov_124_951821_g186_i0NODE_219_length_11213_cov_124_951821_g186_i0_p4_ORF_typecomplete_len429_score102_88Cupin_8/PF13621_6/2_6e30Cupin_4/PF08007_12/1_7e10JmjC/PF02373_22/0_0086Cupin_2/PF07883_11/4_3e03Cupin_2/PF07883_11/0_47_NODE_219_length_11213_cov_124_951821_g186_i0441330